MAVLIFLLIKEGIKSKRIEKEIKDIEKLYK